jgi:hypothetical protein
MTEDWETIALRWRRKEQATVAPPGLVEELLQNVEARQRHRYLRRSAVLAVAGIAATVLWLATAPEPPAEQSVAADLRPVAGEVSGPCNSPGSCLPLTATPGLDDTRLAMRSGIPESSERP